jgi:hypothetical protein
MLPYEKENAALFVVVVNCVVIDVLIEIFV